MKRIVAILGAALLLVTGMVAVEAPEKAEAADARLFDPSYIISDPILYDANAMTEAEISGFLQARIGTCLNANCLNVVRVDTQSRSATPMCSAYQGAAQESAARILFKVQQACGISAKVLLVTLEKEQSLVSHRSPTLSRLDRAMGYACPDNTAIPGWCDPAYGGLYNQLYWAASQLKRYGNPPGTSNYFTWFPVGSPSRVQFHPNTACGSSAITIKNKATAALYYYTPYQPNAAALANLYGTGDSCSSYGNRNFWRLYTDWFGSPTGPSLSPVGNWEMATTDVASAFVRGWAFDPETADPIDVHAYINGQWGGSFQASVSRPDVAAAYPAYGPLHGFAFTLPIDQVAQEVTVCLYGINVGNGQNSPLGCRVVQMPSGPPFGNIEGAGASGGQATISGWVIDPDRTDPVDIAVSVNGVAHSVVKADLARPDVQRFYPSYGPAHGFVVTVPLPVGSAEVCLTATNIDGGANVSMGCRLVATTTGSPTGNLEAVAPGVGSGTFSGWVIDPDTIDPVAIHAYVNGRWGGAYVANANRPDVGRAYPGFGDDHGFQISVPMGGGSNTVCLYGITVRGGFNSLIGCRVVNAPGGSPFGNLEAASVTGSSVNLIGWAIDPDVRDSIDLHVYVNGRWGGAYLANLLRPDVERAYPSYGAGHGFALSVPLSVGSNEVCVFGINKGSGFNDLVGCRTVVRTS